MASPRLPESLRTLADAWVGAVRAPRVRATVAASVLVTTVALLVARQGTSRARLVAAAMLVAVLVVVLAIRAFERRVLSDPTRTIRRVAGRIEPEGAARAIRALSLLEPGAARGSSRELAELHVQRALAALPLDGVRKGAAKLAFILGVAALGLAAVNVAACATNPWGVVEGADVLVSKGGVAPLGMAWLSEPQVRARPPDYLHQEERRVIVYDEVALPRGTLITVRGTPVHS